MPSGADGEGGKTRQQAECRSPHGASPLLGARPVTQYVGLCHVPPPKPMMLGAERSRHPLLHMPQSLQSIETALVALTGLASPANALARRSASSLPPLGLPICTLHDFGAPFASFTGSVLAGTKAM